MKLSLLIRLAEVAELGLPHLEKEHAIAQCRTAIDAAYLEAGKRVRARDLQHANRPARTVRRQAIREQLSVRHHKVRLTRSGQWHVQPSPGTAWLLFALSDGDAENLLNS
jgi:hypothetical protein